MKLFLFGIILLVQYGISSGQNCTLPVDLVGSWLTNDMETVTISQGTPSLTMNVTFTGASQTYMDFNCLLVDGTKYILQSAFQVSTFSGTFPIYMYMCIEFNRASSVSYYYYLHALEEIAFGNRRFTGLLNTTVVTTSSQVCTTTPATEEFGVMVKVGSESQYTTTFNCPVALMGSYYFTSTSVSCSIPWINTCDNETTTSIRVNTTGCSSKVFFSEAGLVGCVASTYNSSLSTYYTMVYNTDSTVDSSTTYRFTCLASYWSGNSTVFVSYVGKKCATGQTALTAPTNGHTLTLTAFVTCVPTEEDSTKDYTLLIVLLVLLFVLIIVAVIVVCLCVRYKKKKKELARQKQPMDTSDHPLGEMSLALDAPASMERVSDNAYVEMGHNTLRTPRKRKKDKRHPLVDESCMSLDLSGRKWSKSMDHDVGLSDIDPFTEMDGSVVPISANGNHTIHDFKNGRPIFNRMKTPRTAITNGNAGQQLAITNGVTGLTLEDLDMYKSMNGSTRPPQSVRKAPSVMTSRSKTNMSIVKTSRPTPSVISARSKTNISIKSKKSPRARSGKAVSVTNGSIRGGTGKSVKAISVVNGAVPRASNKPRLVRSSTSTRIGSITKRLTSPRKTSVGRSNTMVMTTKPDDEANIEAEHTMMAAETGDVLPQPEEGQPVSSQKPVPVTSTGKSPRRSILKKTSAYMTAQEYMTEDEIYADLVNNPEVPPPSVQEDSLPHSLRDSYLAVKQRFDIRANSMRPKATKAPWH